MATDRPALPIVGPVMLLLPFGLLLAALLTPAVSAAPPHLLWAERLVRDLRPEDNSYGGSPTVVQWRGVDGATRSKNRSVCSSFITALFRRAYGYDSDEVRRWLGRSTPKAINYYEAIGQANRFQPVRAVGLIQPGDLLASRQLNPTSTITGHTMLARSRAQPLAGCPGSVCVYRLQVIDSSRSGHGADDTRRGSSGVGMGTIQLQATRQGSVLAYRWSDLKTSRWRHATEEPLLIGRYCGQRCPASK